MTERSQNSGPFDTPRSGQDDRLEAYPTIAVRRGPRLFVPGYDRTVPLGHFATRSISLILKLLNSCNSRTPSLKEYLRPLAA
jgi:hypothetical protein